LPSAAEPATVGAQQAGFADLGERDVNDIAKERRSSEKARAGHVGEVLVSWGKLTREQLRAALDLKKNDPRRLDEILLSQNLVSAVDLAQALAHAVGFEYVSLSEDRMDPAVVPLLSEKVLRKYAALPLRVEDGRLVLAMSDPTNVLALDDMKTLAGYPIRPVVATEEDIRKLQDRMFGINEEISEFMREAEERGPVSGEDGSLSVSMQDEGAPVVRLVNSIIRRALSERASDIHIEPRAKEVVVRYRIDGVLKRVTSVPLRMRDTVISRFKIMGNLDISV
jgi:type IV pilus assembly protein PilB